LRGKKFGQKTWSKKVVKKRGKKWWSENVMIFILNNGILCIFGRQKYKLSFFLGEQSFKTFRGLFLW